MRRRVLAIAIIAVFTRYRQRLGALIAHTAVIDLPPGAPLPGPPTEPAEPTDLPPDGGES